MLGDLNERTGEKEGLERGRTVEKEGLERGRNVREGASRWDMLFAEVQLRKRVFSS